MEEVKEESDATEKKEEKENSPTCSNTLSSLPPGLLEKVRAKEAAKAVREMTRTAEEKKRIERLRRMPDLARFVPHQRENFQKLDFFLCRKMRTLLIAERRAAVNVNFAVTKLLALTPQHQTADKHRLEGNSLNTRTRNLKMDLILVNCMLLSDDLRLLSVETEGWLSIHRVAMEDHFKIAKPHKINKVVEILEYKLAKALK